MDMNGHHLAELNIGRLVAPTVDPRVADFMAALDRGEAFGWGYLKDAQLRRTRGCAQVAAE